LSAQIDWHRHGALERTNLWKIAALVVGLNPEEVFFDGVGTFAGGSREFETLLLRVESATENRRLVLGHFDYVPALSVYLPTVPEGSPTDRDWEHKVKKAQARDAINIGNVKIPGVVKREQLSFWNIRVDVPAFLRWVRTMGYDIPTPLLDLFNACRVGAAESGSAQNPTAVPSQRSCALQVEQNDGDWIETWPKIVDEIVRLTGETVRPPLERNGKIYLAEIGLTIENKTGLRSHVRIRRRALMDALSKHGRIKGEQTSAAGVKALECERYSSNSSISVNRSEQADHDIGKVR
jgi:hypothetical protein